MTNNVQLPTGSTAGIAFLLIALGGYGLYLQVNGKLTGTLSKIFGYTSKSSTTSSTVTNASNMPSTSEVKPLDPMNTTGYAIK